MTNAPPSPQKSHPPLSQQPPLKVEVLSSPPFFKIWLEAQPPPPPPPLAERWGCTLWGWNRGPFTWEKLQILPINVLFPPNELYDTYVDVDDDLQLNVNICNNLVAEIHTWSILTVPIYFTIFPFSKTQLSIYNVICTFLVKYYLKSPLY